MSSLVFGKPASFFRAWSRLAGTAANDEIKVKILRKGKTKSFKVTLGEMSPDDMFPQMGYRDSHFGIHARQTGFLSPSSAGIPQRTQFLTLGLVDHGRRQGLGTGQRIRRGTNG